VHALKNYYHDVPTSNVGEIMQGVFA
jgi:hypothetical protein